MDKFCDGHDPIIITRNCEQGVATLASEVGHSESTTSPDSCIGCGEKLSSSPSYDIITVESAEGRVPPPGKSVNENITIRPR